MHLKWLWWTESILRPQNSTHSCFSYGNKIEVKVRLAVDQEKLSTWLTLLVMKNRWTNSWPKTDRHKLGGSGQSVKRRVEKDFRV